MKPLLSLLFAIGLTATACSDAPTATEAEQTQRQGVMVQDARILPPFPGRDTAASYFTLVNQGGDTKLVSVASPLSDRVEIHNHINDNGVMKMRRVDGVDLSKGQTLEFKPGSYHVMMFKVQLGDDVTSAPLSLTFDNGDTVTMTIPIEGREPNDQNSHNGH